jgi:hypothetical protein
MVPISACMLNRPGFWIEFANSHAIGRLLMMLCGIVRGALTKFVVISLTVTIAGSCGCDVSAWRNFRALH